MLFATRLKLYNIAYRKTRIYFQAWGYCQWSFHGFSITNLATSITAATAVQTASTVMPRSIHSVIGLLLKCGHGVPDGIVCACPSHHLFYCLLGSIHAWVIPAEQCIKGLFSPCVSTATRHLSTRTGCDQVRQCRRLSIPLRRLSPRKV